MGFQKHTDGSYTFIGLYTIGPDKGDSGTFGYDTTIFPELLSIEGPNHAPLGTRFIHPWIDVAYDSTEETLTFGGQEGWDTASYNDGKYATTGGVLTLDVDAAGTDPDTEGKIVNGTAITAKNVLAANSVVDIAVGDTESPFNDGSGTIILQLGVTA